jgi:hypothetical protein
LLIEKLLKHHLVVLIKGLVYVFKEEVVVGEGRVSGFHEILKVLVVDGRRAFLSGEGALRVKDLGGVNV